MQRDRRFVVFFFNDTATTEIYTLSLHDALPISAARADPRRLRPHRPPADLHRRDGPQDAGRGRAPRPRDRKSTRLNSSHANISYAVFCLKQKDMSAVSLFVEVERAHAFLRMLPR